MFLIDKIRMKLSKVKKTDLYEKTETYQQRLALLTTPEYKVFMLLREGFSKKECSQRLNIKRRVVNKHIVEIYSKLNIRTIAELIVKYRKIS